MCVFNALIQRLTGRRRTTSDQDARNEADARGHEGRAETGRHWHTRLPKELLKVAIRQAFFVNGKIRPCPHAKVLTALLGQDKTAKGILTEARLPHRAAKVVRAALVRLHAAVAEAGEVPGVLQTLGVVNAFLAVDVGVLVCGHLLARRGDPRLLAHAGILSDFIRGHAGKVGLAHSAELGIHRGSGSELCHAMRDRTAFLFGRSLPGNPNLNDPGGGSDLDDTHISSPDRLCCTRRLHQTRGSQTGMGSTHRPAPE